MKDLTKFIVGALIIGVAIVIGFVLAKPIVQYGASSGPDHYNLEYFYGGLIQGGGTVTLTTGTSVTMTAADVCNYSYIKWVHTGATTGTTTLPTAASLISRCLAKVGDYKEVIFANTAAASASTTAFTTGTGLILLIPDDGGNRVINGMSLAKLTFIVASSTHVYLNIEELVPSP